MNYYLALASFLLSFTGFSQQDSLVITTRLPVDSIYAANRKVDFLQVNDTLVKMGIDCNGVSADDKLAIHSGEKRYEISLPKDPATAFPAEWTVRDPNDPITIRMSVKKGEWVVMRADGSAVNVLSSLIVYERSGDLILEESSGITTVRTKTRSPRVKTQ